jgi:hypothetical protein
MILYNVTVNVDDSINEEWLEWMKTKHIPDVMATGLFAGNKLFRIDDPKAEEGTTYAIQYFCNSMEDYSKYRVEFAPSLQDEHQKKYGGKFVAFRTLLTEI